jgi:hypothetical protein
MNTACIPPINLFYFGADGPIPASEKIQDTPFPLALHPGEGAPPLTFGNYFGLIGKFVEDHLSEFFDLAEKEFGGPSPTISEIQIVSEKHGSDYHPARINLISESGVLQLAANVALTERGFERISREFAAMRKLRERYAGAFIPQVYFLDAVEDGGIPALIFIGQWLDGYHEFHPTTADASEPIKLWDRQSGDCVLTPTQTALVYGRCSFILTYYYDIEDFSEIFPWHHAAGDFVASRNGNKVDVKLISVRQHAPRIVGPDGSENGGLGALLIFFANLTVRMRLDRMDGIGDFTWAPKKYVPVIIQGFWAALETNRVEGRISKRFLGTFRELARLTSLEEFVEMFAMVVDGYDPEAPDYEPIVENLTDHIWEVYKALQDFFD